MREVAAESTPHQRTHEADVARAGAHQRFAHGQLGTQMSAAI